MSLSIDEVIYIIGQGKKVEYKYSEATSEWQELELNNFTLENLFDENYSFRIKPEIITIGDVSFPKPESENPKSDTEYFFPSFFRPYLVGCFEWAGDDDDYKLLKAGLVHLTKENAIAHAKALIKLSGGTYE